MTWIDNQIGGPKQLLYSIILSISALHNNLQSHRNINVSSAGQNAICLFGTNLVFLRGDQMSPNGQSALTDYLPYLPVTAHPKVHSNYVGFMNIAE